MPRPALLTTLAAMLALAPGAPRSACGPRSQATSSTVRRPAARSVARFTPPRSGTFMYHTHVDEPRQQCAGLVGPLIVRDAAPSDTTPEITFLFKLARFRDRGPFEINGMRDPDTLRVRAGQSYRERFIALHNEFPYITAAITARADSSPTNVPDPQVARWTPLAKDGAELSADAKVPRLARQQVSMSETYDFELEPERVGHLRLELRAGLQLVARTPILVY